MLSDIILIYFSILKINLYIYIYIYILYLYDIIVISDIILNLFMLFSSGNKVPLET